jgi:hypothetical protein
MPNPTWPTRNPLDARLRRAAVVALCASALVAPAGFGQEADETFALQAPMPKAAAKAPREVPSRRLGSELSHLLAPQLALDTVNEEALLREDAVRAAGAMTKVLRIGVGRDFVLSEQDGAWTDLADGSRLWVADVVSPDAVGLRLRFVDVRLPAGAELAVYGDDGEPGRAEFFFASAATRPTFWTGTVAGERAHVEYLAPAGSAGIGLPFRLDRLQHVYRDPVAHLAKAAGPCHNDVSCFPEWQGTANAVAGYGVVGEDFLLCTGQLINNLKGDFTPYFLTANHCINNPDAGPIVEFFWYYQTAGCGAPPPSLATTPRSVGATLLSTNFQSDYTLLQVEGALPNGLTWSGWNAKAPGDGTDAVAIHHPQGDFKRISFGFKGPLGECTAGFPGRQLVRVNWTDAPTEPGSSGSGIFRADTGQLFGQLLGGPSSCGNESFDCYGSFVTTYARIKSPLVKGGTDDKSDQNDSCAKARKVKAGGLPARIVKINDEDWYQISIKPGQILDVSLDFAHANGDVDLQFYAACGQEPFVSSVGTEDNEFISVQNVGNKPAVARWRVFLANDTRNSYNQTVSVH